MFLHVNYSFLSKSSIAHFQIYLQLLELKEKNNGR
jgi:hypothetical protein